jgi:hypothetical protein
MAYQKLQRTRAIQVIPTDGVAIPSPSDEVAAGTNDVVLANHLEDTTANFLGTVTAGATVYNNTTKAAATVEAISNTALRLSANIFPVLAQNYTVYNTSNSEGPVLFCGQGGDLAIITVGGDKVTLTNIADASFIPLMVKTVQATATTCDDIIALW